MLNENTQSNVDEKKWDVRARIAFGISAAVFAVIIVVVYIIVVKEDAKKNVFEYNIGEAGKILNWEISVTDFTETRGSEANTKVIRVTYKVKNTGTSSKYFLGEFLISNGDVDTTLFCRVGGKEYKYNGSFGSDNDLYGSIEPLAEKQGIISYTVPDTLSVDENEFFVKATENRQNYKNELIWKLKK